MQALAYWLGYERERYRYYNLREIAIVSELVCLLGGALSKKGWLIDCEVPFSEILGIKKNLPQKRIDFAIRKYFKKKYNKKRYSVLIEVKRFKSRIKAIEKDVKRIASLKSKKKDLSGWVIVCSHGNLPPIWLNASGHARHKHFNVDGGMYRIRRIVHASPYTDQWSNKKKNAGNIKRKGGFHVALLEVM